MKGFIELTDSLDNRCTLKASQIAKVCERIRYRNYELDDHPELGTKDENGKWDKATKSTYIQGEFPCRDLYVKESYEEVLKMIEEALEPSDEKRTKKRTSTKKPSSLNTDN